MTDTDVRVLIVDDIEDNRIILKSLCRKIDSITTYEAENGLQALERVSEGGIDIVLMDVMMPVMDGYEATKRIKELSVTPYILVVTAVTDKETEQSFSQLGVDGYIKKPIDKELLRAKLEFFSNAVLIKKGVKTGLSSKKPITIQATSCRNFKTYFSIENDEDIMSFGIYISERKEYFEKSVTFAFEEALATVYKLCKQLSKASHAVTLVVEEDFERLYLTIIPNTAINADELLTNIERHPSVNIQTEHSLMYIAIDMKEEGASEPKRPLEPKTPPSTKEKIALSDEDLRMLRFSHTNKISATTYAEELTRDGVIDEIYDLKDIESVWHDAVTDFKEKKTRDSLVVLADGAISDYAKTVNKLYEFSAIGYALSSLAAFLKTLNEETLNGVNAKLAMLLEHVVADLASWRETIFVARETADIHYLDSSLLSSCMQIDAIASGKVAESDDEDELELF